MARPNGTQMLESVLKVLPGLEKKYVSYEELAQKMGCSVEDAIGTIADLSDSESNNTAMDFYVLSAEDAMRELAAGNGKDTDALAPLTKSGGIAIGRSLGIFSRPPRLTVEESQALISALDYAKIPNDASIRKTLGKSVMPTSMQSRDAMQVYISSAEDYTILRNLSLLCKQNRLASIEYVSASDSVDDVGNIKPRKIAPQQLYTQENGEVYLSAYCYTNEEMRTFKVARILSLDPLPEHSSKDVRSLASDKELIDEDAPLAKLEMNAGQCIDDRVWIKSKVEENPDGSKTATLPLQENTTWIAKHIVARLGEMRVSEPESLRVEVRGYAKFLQEDIAKMREELAVSSDRATASSSE